MKIHQRGLKRRINVYSMVGNQEIKIIQDSLGHLNTSHPHTKSSLILPNNEPLSLLPFTLCHGLLCIFADVYSRLCLFLVSNIFWFLCNGFLFSDFHLLLLLLPIAFVQHTLSHTSTHTHACICTHLHATLKILLRGNLTQLKTQV